MSVFLTPDGRPFYGGTYFPDTPRHGMPSFRQVLEGVRTGVDDAAAGGRAGGGAARRRARRVAGDRDRRAGPSGVPPARGRSTPPRPRDRRLVRPGQRRLGPRAEVPAADDDRVPAPAARRDRRSAAARGRAPEPRRDGGGRDPRPAGRRLPPLRDRRARGSCPHFEQMLYDNAQLARVYVARVGADRRRVAAGDGDRGARLRAARAARRADGGFAASQDADTEGEEGATFVWTAGEVREVLGDDAALFSAAYGVTDARQLGGPDDPVARPRRRRAGGAVRAVGRRGREPARRRAGRRCCARRGTRPQPARDDKVLAAWNGLAIAAFADAARSLAATGRAGAGRGVGAGTREAAIAGGRRRCSTTSAGRTAGSGGRGGTAGRRRTACSRTTRTSRTGCSPCTRRRSTSAGSTPPSALVDVVLAHFAAPRRRLLRHARRRRAAGRPAAGRPGQRDAVGRRDGHDRPAPARGADRRGPLPDGRRAGARDGRAATSSAIRRRSRSGCARSSWRTRASTEVAIVGEPGDPATAGARRRRRPRLPPVPRPGVVGGARRHRRCRCSTAGSRSTAGRRRSCATASPAACPVTEPEALEALLAGADGLAGRGPGVGPAPRRRRAAAGLDRRPHAPGPARPGGAADATAVDDGVRAGPPRVPGRRRRRRRRRPTAGRRSRGLRGRASGSWPRRWASPSTATPWSRCRAGSRRPAARAGTTPGSSSPGCPTARRSCPTPTRSPTTAG